MQSAAELDWDTRSWTFIVIAAACGLATAPLEAIGCFALSIRLIYYLLLHLASISESSHCRARGEQ